MHAISKPDWRRRSFDEAAAFSWEVGSGRMRCSDAVGDLLGIEPGRPSSLPEYIELVHPRDRRRLQTALERALDHAGPFSCEVRIVRPDGELRRILIEAEGIAD